MTLMSPMCVQSCCGSAAAFTIAVARGRTSGAIGWRRQPENERYSSTPLAYVLPVAHGVAGLAGRS